MRPESFKLSKHSVKPLVQTSWFYLCLFLLYAATILLGLYIHKPSILHKSLAINAPIAQQTTAQPVTSVIYGLPVRIVIPSVSVDLPVDKGYYDKVTGAWTLSDNHAQFATISSIANNDSGDTFIYGHEYWNVFTPIKSVKPGDEALVYTDNGHVFSYLFQTWVNITPADTSILKYKGPPILTIQTCDGNLFEWRQLFRFNFNEVVQ